MGRTITEEEDRPKNDDVVLIGYGLWQRRFGSDPELLGQKILLNARPFTVIGIMPEGFRFPDIADYWVPLGLTTQMYTRTDHGLSAIARLKDGVTVEQAAAELTDLAGRIEQQNPVTNEGLSVSVTSLYDALTGDYHR